MTRGRINKISLMFPFLVIAPGVHLLTQYGLGFVLALFFIFIIFINLAPSQRDVVSLDSISALILFAVIGFSILSVMHYVFFSGDQIDWFLLNVGSAIGYKRYYSVLFVLTVYWLFVGALGLNLKKCLYIISKYYFFLSLLTILWGGLVIAMGWSRFWEPMYLVESASPGRAAGLTGNAAVNGVSFVVSYLILLRYPTGIAHRFPKALYALLVVGVVTQMSGSGMASLIIASIVKLRMDTPSLLKKMILIFLGLVAFTIGTLYSVQAIRRVSTTYILYILSVFFQNIDLFFSFQLSPLDYIFGKAVPLKYSGLTSDFGPLFLLNIMGIPYLILINLFLVRVAFVSRNIIDWGIFAIVFITGFHYMAIFTLAVSILYSLYMASIILKTRSVNESDPTNLVS